jgi:hypothetical protein
MKEPNMKRRAFFGPAALLLAGLAGGVPAAHAAVDIVVPLAGIVSAEPESVSFSGQAQIHCRLVRDPDFDRPSLLLRIDLSGVSGVGSSTNATYVVSSQELVQRRLARSHLVVITFPFTAADGSGTPQSAVAAFTLDFDVNTGTVTGTGKVVTPRF